MDKIVQCSSSFSLSKMNKIFIPIFVIIKTISGKVLVFLSKLESQLINFGL